MMLSSRLGTRNISLSLSLKSAIKQKQEVQDDSDYRLNTEQLSQTQGRLVLKQKGRTGNVTTKNLNKSDYK